MLFEFNQLKKKYEFKFRFENNNLYLYNNSLKCVYFEEMNQTIILTAGEHQMSFFNSQNPMPIYLNTNMKEDIEMI